MAKTSSPADLLEYVDTHRVELAQAPLAAQFTALMATIKRNEADITAAPRMTAEVKRTQLDRLIVVRQEASAKYRAAMQKIAQQAEGAPAR